MSASGCTETTGEVRLATSAQVAPDVRRSIDMAPLPVRLVAATTDSGVGAPQHSLTVTGCPGSDTVPCTITRPAVPVQVSSDCEP